MKRAFLFRTGAGLVLVPPMFTGTFAGPAILGLALIAAAITIQYATENERNQP